MSERPLCATCGERPRVKHGSYCSPCKQQRRRELRAGASHRARGRQGKTMGTTASLEIEMTPELARAWLVMRRAWREME